ncbi:hypothetical protein K402DRAFT_244180 [Aulographum hederae CBS 113979]|uniref:Uncharacterized protein n=1 Tax=Aulographum hederae CBS 113979 TaxID=1176131 RepID=A0A6G1H9P8_9PEZI|nr:hypothetical protein K402DRAFT_244180 [Aulographum hederae CBS 113979]
MAPMTPSPARRTFDLRVLLKEVTSSEGEQARNKPKAWIDLTSLISSLPIDTLVETLFSLKLLEAAENSLAKLLPEDITKYSVSADASHYSEPVDTATGESRKRKREADPVAESFETIHAIGETVSTFHAICCSDDAERVARHYLPTLPTPDYRLAASLLNHWLLVLISANNTHFLDLIPRLASFIAIWRLSSDDASSYSDTQVAFSDSCLVSTAVLYARLQRLLIDNQQKTLQTKSLSEGSDLLEQLIAQFILRPTENQFFKVYTKSQEAHVEAFKLLAPLKIKKGDDPAHLRPVLPLLLDLAIRSTSAKRESTQIQLWHQIAFNILAESVSDPRDNTDAPLEQPLTDHSHVGLMLAVFKKRKVVPTAEFLANVVKDHSGLNTNDGTPVSWPIVSQALELNEDVFIDRGRSLHENTTAKPHLPSLIFARIPLACALQAKPIVGAESNSDAVEDEVQIVKAIATTLLHAYCRNNKLGGFFTRWYEQLMRPIPLPQRGSYTYIWQENDLSLELRELLEDSLAKNQIESILRGHCRRIDASNQAFENLKLGTEVPENLTRGCYGSLIIVEAILGAVRTEETIAHLVRVQMDIRKCLWQLGEHCSRLELDFMPMIWRLLGRTHMLLRAYEDKESLVPVFGSRCFSSAQETIENSKNPPEHCDASLIVSNVCASYLNVLRFAEQAWREIEKVFDRSTANIMLWLIHRPEWLE